MYRHYFMALSQCKNGRKGQEDKIMGGSATTSYKASSKSGKVARDLMENTK
jgi:hypothetical protein